MGCTVGSRAGDDTGRLDARISLEASTDDAGSRVDAGDGASAGDASDAAPGRDASLPDGGPDRPCTAEVCSNGLDDDCNGAVDDGCACVPGDTMPCFRGAPSRRGHGLCIDGTIVCTGLEVGMWGACAGDVLETSEVCDPAGLDEDCDGTANEGCECDPADPPLPCGSDVGACVAGTQRCDAGMLTACEGATAPGAETCDGTDEDCDGAIDEGLTRTCGSSVGRCRTGIAACSDGRWGVCAGEVSAGTETCDGTDEDCDGSTDEGTDRVCGTDTGACATGVQRCVSGAYATCEGGVRAIAERCNGLDDDCDGSVDEGLVRACGTDVGACTAGTQACSAGAWAISCSGEAAPGPELCDGVLDESCDGTVDEGCGCTSGATRACGTDVGACMAGTQTCSVTGSWSACAGAIDPAPERCDGTVDDDCDGTVDDGCACVTGALRSCGTDEGECVAGTETCATDGTWATCSGAVGPSAEVCNGRDDDCDGLADEDDVCPRSPPLAMCPAPRTTPVGTAASLVGVGSDPDGGAVSYAWTVVVRPGGSSAMPGTPASASTSFTPDAVGSYTLRLCVTDDEAVTTCCTTNVTATATCTAPPVPSATTCGTSWDRRPIVELGALPAGQTYELFLDGAGTPYGTVTTTGQNYFRPPAAIAAGGPPPGARATITVRACMASEPACCSATTSLSVNLIEACTTPRAPGALDVVFSEYVIDGSGACPGATCEAGEAFEITNLTNCPITLAGDHFFYCNGSDCAPGSYRWMDFGAGDVVPPRGVYVAIRDQADAMAMCSYPFFGPDDPGLFGLHVSTLAMQGTGLASGWFANMGGGRFRIATGAYVSPTGGTTIDSLTYAGGPGGCGSAGYDALDRCGDFTPTSTFGLLPMNQLGRLWHPCDAVAAPVPATCR